MMITKEEKWLLNSFRRIDARGKSLVINMIQFGLEYIEKNRFKVIDGGSKNNKGENDEAR